LTLDRTRDAALCVCLLALGSVTPRLAIAEDPQAAADPGTQQARSIEDLNMKGASAENPPFTDTVLGADSAFRRSLFNHGLLLRMTASGAYIQNTLEAPVAAAAQTYTGQREFGEYSLNPVFTADLRQLGLHKAQLTINGQLQQATWGPAQPTAFTVDSIYFYKEFGQDRVELKIGYLTTDFQFIGLQVGGQVTSGAQGVYAVLPYEVGISYTPVEAPAVTLKYRWDNGLYLKGAVQRAGEPGSEEAALHRDAVGLRFLPHGDKLLLVGEAGLRQPTADGKLSQWYRAGIITNNTPYPNLATGQMQSGNYCAYLLADHQLWQPQASNPGRGIYAGGSAMFVPASLDAYRQYDEARIYYAAPFRNRRDDFASIVASYTAFSQDFLHTVAAAGKPYWRSSNSVTGSYTAHLVRGTYLGLGLSYVNGPSITPKAPAALTFTAQTSVFF
jgi:porin